MVASADEGLTYEPNPRLVEVLLRNRTQGLRLAGACAIRPHYTEDLDISSQLYELASGLVVVRLPNSEGLQCVGTHCIVVGESSRLGPSRFDGKDDPGSKRLFIAFQEQVRRNSPRLLSEARFSMKQPRVQPKILLM